MAINRVTLVAAAFALVVSGCMMAPVRPEVPLLGNDLSIRAMNPSDAKIVFFNNSNRWLYGLDRTGRINIWLDGKAVAGPNIGEYVQLQIPKGKHQLELEHLDMVKHRSVHEINAIHDTVFVEVRATPFSNEFQLHDTMPSDEFRPIAVAMRDD